MVAPRVMTRIQRRIFARGALVGLLLTVIVIAADLAGALTAPEAWLYDQRARFFQFFTPKPSDLLVHVDIDDRALEQIGAWPWKREHLAQIIDEMRLAGAKAVALDVLFTEPQDPQPITATLPDGSASLIRTIDHDAEFAAAVARLGNVVIPASLDFDTTRSPALWTKIVEVLIEDPEADETALASRLAPDRPDQVREYFLTARRVAIYRRVSREMASGPGLSRDDLRKRLLKTHQADVHTPLSRAFDEEYARWQSTQAIERGAPKAPAISPPPIIAPIKLVPVPALAQASAASGFVDFTTDRDGVLRSVPLLVELDGRLIPQMGLSLALRTLGVQVSDLKVSDSEVIIPVPGGRTIHVAVEPRYVRSQQREAGLIFNLPWFGSDRSEDMYDWPSHTVRHKQHLALNLIWTACDTRRKIITNNANIADILPELQKRLNVPGPATGPASVAEDDPDRYFSMIDRVLIEGAGWEKDYREIPPQERDLLDREFLQGMDILRTVRAENPKLAEQLKAARAVLTEALSGKSALIGWAATGMMDVTTTSLHARCPGVITHGVVFNSIMTGDFWRSGPAWMTFLATLILGVVVTATASWLSPMLGLGITLIVAAGFVALNGLLLFDRGNLLVGLAGPLGAAMIVWAGCTLNRMITEASERARITRRLGSYVDRTLVDYVLANPDKVRLEGETRELTVVFTDLKGFTAISERLGEATVPLLNDYMGRMVPIVAAEKGYVNKFLGDGIMFFYGAPIPNSDHAAKAVEAVLEMQRVVEKFNEELAAQGLPDIGMRAGISSGMMVVGDAGPSERSDYTVLGDNVNLAARLESANKAVGTKILMNARTAELLDGRFLLRPIGKLQVVGKEQGVMTYEAICVMSEATEQQKRLASRTKELVDAFIGRQFDECLRIADSMDAEFGATDLTDRYREECRDYLANPPGEAFDGRIKLSEK